MRKHWIKRSLIGLFGGALVAGSIAGCAGNRHGWNQADAGEFRAKMVERVGDKLELDAGQKQKLAVLADKLQAQRAAIRAAGAAGAASGAASPRAQFTALFSSDKLDQAGATQLIDEKTAAVRAGSGEVIAAAADFFDNLRPEQQQQVREFMQRGRRWGRHG